MLSLRIWGKSILSHLVVSKEISKDKITLTLQNFNKTETFYSELFIFHTSSHNFFQFVAFQGEHSIVLKRINQDDKDEIKVNIKNYIDFVMVLLILSNLY